MIIDTHCHLDFKDFDQDRDGVIDRARKAGVNRIVNVGSSIEGTRRSIELAKRYDIVYASLGVHPHEAKSVTDKTIDDFRALAKERKVVAIGEVGLDYYRNLSPKEVQVGAFKKFIHLAGDLKLPMILHSREADREVLDILRKEKEKDQTGVMHCFSGDEDFLKECLDLGLFISFTCNLTFKNAKNLREVAKGVPAERLLLETDAPFLAPQEFRGKRNEPSYLVYLVEEWSKVLGLSKDDIARITTHNANRLFKLNIEEPSEIAYPIRDSLYLNITNECTNACDFCIRYYSGFVKGHNLRLGKEPTLEEIQNAIGDPKRYKEIVFCGYGEPTTRLDVIKAVSKELKSNGVKVRLVTNGHGDLINSRPIVKELLGLVDKVSVSLNVDTQEQYNKICKPNFGADTYKKVLDFAKDCIRNNIETEITCLDLPDVDIKRCERIVKELGAIFRLRRMGVTG
ncbi:MAG: YchF/TatD family DNA exonuclease [Candidatus Omnitrophica bacterium]|nr:YchF/TatD family DNA exonuclease [Candidatus Omnitrophota bacterium]